jgi:hypothetical protein
MNHSHRFMALGAAAISALAFASCGGVSDSDVASIDGTTISKTTFDRWVTVAASASQDPTANHFADEEDKPHGPGVQERNTWSQETKNAGYLIK